MRNEMEKDADTPERTDEGDVADVLSRVAEQRRVAAKKELERKPPEMVRSILKSEVFYKIAIRSFPFSQIDFAELADRLNTTYRLTWDRPQVPGVPHDLLDGDLARLLQDAGSTLRFRNGVFPTGRNQVVPIFTVLLDRETLLVNVGGVSKVAELVAQEVFEFVWSSIGSQKKWDEVAEDIISMGYATSTRVDLGVPLKALLSQSVVDALNRSFVDGERFVDHMGEFSKRHGFNPPPESMAVWNAQEITLRFNRFDVTTGLGHEADFTLNVGIRDDIGSSIVQVTSLMPYEAHVRALQLLRDNLMAGSQ